MAGLDDLELIAVLLGAAMPGIIAIGLTMYTVRQTRRQHRLDTFTRLHDLLTAQESQRGRRKLFAAAESGVWPERGSVDWDEINRALSMLETLAMYINRKIVNRDLVMEAWHHSLRRLQGPAEHFIALRCGDHRLWPHLRTLLRDANSYRSRLDCCNLSLDSQEPRDDAGMEPDEDLNP